MKGLRGAGGQWQPQSSAAGCRGRKVVRMSSFVEGRDPGVCSVELGEAGKHVQTAGSGNTNLSAQTRVSIAPSW
jgi:hypothetical protein